MGLDCSYNAFRGSYSSFNRLKGFVLKAIGGSYPPHKDISLNPDMWYFGDNYEIETHIGLTEFLSHSDCDGNISPEMCKIVADELEAILPMIEKLEQTEKAVGHIALAGGYYEAIRKFISGCRIAHKNNEPLLFQ